METDREPDLDPGSLQAWKGLIVASSRLVDRLEDELGATLGLRLTWFEILHWLDEAGPGGLRMQDLADTVLLSRSGLTRVVDRMEGAGLVERQACASDRRGTSAVITAEGLKLLERARPLHLDGIRRHFAAHLTPDETKWIGSGLAKVVVAAGGWPAPESPA